MLSLVITVLVLLAVMGLAVNYLGLHLAAQVFTAVGTLGVAVLAIWGETIRARFAGPKLRFGFDDYDGHLTRYEDGRQTIYYHVKLRNERPWSQARNARVVCTGISKRASDGSFVPEGVPYPILLTWTPADFYGPLQTVVHESTCDLGFLDQGSAKFTLAHYFWPHDFPGTISANQAMRVRLIALADNFTSASTYVLEIHWDGVWSADPVEMRKHLVIKEVDDTDSKA